MIIDWLRPRLWGLHVFAIASVVACVVGGLWQFGAWEDHRSVETSSRAAVELSDLWQVGRPFPADAAGRRVVLEGTFGPESVSGDGPGTSWTIRPFVMGTSALLVVLGDGEADPPEADRITVVLEPRDAHLNIARLANQLPYRLFNGYGVALSDAGEPVVRVAPPDVGWSVGLRNLAYSVQWWAFAAFAVFMWWRMARESIAEARAGDGSVA